MNIQHFCAEARDQKLMHAQLSQNQAQLSYRQAKQTQLAGTVPVISMLSKRTYASTATK